MEYDGAALNAGSAGGHRTSGAAVRGRERRQKERHVDVDFAEAAVRHYEDGEKLHASGSIPNAGQLFGFCAECGLKALLVAFGADRDPASGDLLRDDSRRRHIERLWATMDTFPTSDAAYSRYLGMIRGLGDFRDWSTSHRYCASSAIPNSCELWRAAARSVREMVDVATIDGRM